MIRSRLAVAFVAALAGTGCFGGVEEITQAECDPTTAVLALVDISPSTRNPEVSQLYLSSFSRVMESAEEYWQIGVDRIDDAPLSHSRFDFNECLLPLENVDPVTELEHLQSLRRGARTAVETLLSPETPSSRGTAILDSLQLAERYFASYVAVGARYLVLFSDMLEKSERYRFDGPGLKPDAVSAFIEGERSAGTLPDLTGVEVYVVGAGATAAGGVDSKRFQAVKDFWLAYVAATGANLPAHRYGSALVRFP